MVETNTLQSEILELIHKHHRDNVFTAKDAYNSIKGELPINSIVQSTQNLGSLLNACAIKPVGDILVERAKYDSTRKVNRWRVVPVTSTVTPPHPGSIPLVETAGRVPAKVDPSGLEDPTVYERDVNDLIGYCAHIGLYDHPVSRRAVTRWLSTANGDANKVALIVTRVAKRGGYQFPIARVDVELSVYMRDHPTTV